MAKVESPAILIDLTWSDLDRDIPDLGSWGRVLPPNLRISHRALRGGRLPTGAGRGNGQQGPGGKDKGGAPGFAWSLSGAAQIGNKPAGLHPERPIVPHPATGSPLSGGSTAGTISTRRLSAPGRLGSAFAGRRGGARGPDAGRKGTARPYPGPATPCRAFFKRAHPLKRPLFRAGQAKGRLETADAVGMGHDIEDRLGAVGQQAGDLGDGLRRIRGKRSALPKSK